MQLEEVRGPAGRDRLPVALDVVRRDDQAAAVDLDAQQTVVQDVPAALAGRQMGTAFGGGGGGGAAGTPARACGAALKTSGVPPSPASARWAVPMISFSSRAMRR